MSQIESFATDISVESYSPAVPNMNDSLSSPGEFTPDRTIDITRDLCPMTFVRTRLALDCLASGQVLQVLLRGNEPLRNVPASATALGHTVLSQTAGADGITRLLLRRA